MTRENFSGGTYGELVVNYSTDHVDIVKAATQAGQTVLSYFTPRSVVSLPQTMTMVSVAAQEDPLLVRDGKYKYITNHGMHLKVREKKF